MSEEGCIPTAWLLSAFMNPDIVQETDAWSSTLTEQILDRLVIEGNTSFTLFVLMGLLKRKQGELLSITTKEDLFDCLLTIPWGLVDSDVVSVLEDASTFRESTPVSILYGVYGILSQCSPGLLPVAVQGSMSVWITRMLEFYE